MLTDDGAAIPGVLLATRVVDGVVTDVRCDVDRVVVTVDIRERCWVDPVTGMTFVNHRYNGWCCQILGEGDLMTASSNGSRLNWGTVRAGSPDHVGVVMAGAGFLLVAVLVAFVIGLVTDVFLSAIAKIRQPVSHQVLTDLVGNSAKPSRP